MEKIKRVLFEEPTCLKENMFDISTKLVTNWKELHGCFLMFETYMLLLAVKTWCSKHQRTIAIGKTGSLCGPLVYLMFLEATQNKLVRKYVPDFVLRHGFSGFLEHTKTT